MRRIQAAIVSTLFCLSACQGGATSQSGKIGGGRDGGSVSPSADGGGVDSAPSAKGDAATRLPESVDASTPSAADAGEGADASSPRASCHDVTFRLVDATARSVWVTGSFTNWAATPAAGAIELARTGDEWVGTAKIEAGGRHLYKFVIDGTNWMGDPGNPEREPDGFGGFNSVLSVCDGRVEVLSQRTDSATGTFVASIRVAGVDATDATLTVDRRPAPASAMQQNADTLEISLTGLARGIHDVRLVAGASDLILKVYVGVSTDWKDSTIYFVMTDRFRNGDPSNDRSVGGVQHPINNYLGGDFAGVRQAIEAGYFDELGVGSLWLSWPADNTDTAWSGLYRTYSGCQRTGETSTTFAAYHGYWPKSGRDIEEHFGTQQDLEAVIDAAHAHGIRVLLDFAANHMHQDSSTFQAHPGWFNQPPVLCRDGHWDDALREECWFDSFLPDWNYANADARRFVLDEAETLAKALGADGFRVDALKHMENAFITELRRRLSSTFEHTGVRFYMVGETFTGDVGLINTYVNPSMMDGQFDFPSNMAILQGLANDQVGLADMHRWVRTNKAGYGAAAPYMSTFIGNHDIARFVSKASGDLPCGIWSQEADQSRAYDSPPPQPSNDAPYRRLQMALTYAYTVPGIPLIYYGDEIGLAGAGDPDNRRMMPAESALNDQQRSTKAFVAKLGQARARAEVLRSGGWTDVLAGDASLLAFGRTSPRQNALIILNRGGDRTFSVPVSALGLADGTVLQAMLGSGSVTVSGGQVSVNARGLSAEIYVSGLATP